MISAEEKSKLEHHNGAKGKSRETCSRHQVSKSFKRKGRITKKKFPVLIDLSEDKFRQWMETRQQHKVKSGRRGKTTRLSTKEQLCKICAKFDHF